MTDRDLIYLDNNATTRVDPAVVEEMMPYLTDLYGNPSSGYRFGQQVSKALDQARAFTDIELGQLHDRVLELDQASKTGRIDAETGLEVLVVELCR